MYRRKGFSLTELLVVISVVTLLTAIYVPVANNAKNALKIATCRSNLQQLGQIWQLYTIDHDGKFMTRGCGYGEGMVSWFECIKDYHDPNDDLITCPLATKTWGEGGRNPYLAWDNTTDSGNYYKGSYGINLWVSNGGSCAYDPCDFDSLCWGTPDIRGTSNTPLVLCSQWKDMQPHYYDEPLEYESYVWTPGWEQEMRRPCIKRHSPYYANIVFLDFSVDKRTIKELWRLKWHKEWPTGADLPVWPEWMEDVPDPDL